MASTSTEELMADIRLLGDLLGESIRAREGEEAHALVEEMRRDAIALRTGGLAGGRDAFAARFRSLDTHALDTLARAFTEVFHLRNAAEEQHRIRVLRRRDRSEAPPEGSVASAFAAAARSGVDPEQVRVLLGRLFIMPVLTAHPTEARRRTVLDQLTEVAAALERLDDPRLGSRDRALTTASLRRAIERLSVTEEARPRRPAPLDEVRGGLDVFERTLLDVTPQIYREVEDALARTWPGEPFTVGPFLRWGTWIGGDRDGNPNVTAEVTRAVLERQRQVVIGRHIRDLGDLGRELSVSARRVPAAGWKELQRALEHDRATLADVAIRAHRHAGIEPWREKLWFMRARLEAARARGDRAYTAVDEYLADLHLLDSTLAACGLGTIGDGRLRDALRRVEVFGFHLATLDLRQHSSEHESAVAELLERGGAPGYRELPEEARVTRLAELLGRLDLGAAPERRFLSPGVVDLLTTLEVVGRARRDSGPEACKRWVISFTSTPSDVLEVLFLARIAGLGPAELRPVPLFERLEDIGRAEETLRRLLALEPVRVAFRGELEVMLGYSDSSKEAGYVASAAALFFAQEMLANLADEHGLTLTVFHGRGGAVGRGGGPANRAIRAQPREALRGRLRVTEQGETVTARYGRPEIARRDLEQMVHAVVLGSLPAAERVSPQAADARRATLRQAAHAAHTAYRRLLSDPARLAAYALKATPLGVIPSLPIASRPASRRPGTAFEDLRAIPWVFSWNQSRHGLPGWYGLGSALRAVIERDGLERVRRLYAEWPFFRALVDNAQLALARADIDVAEQYARLADEPSRVVFEEIRREHALTLATLRDVTGEPDLVAGWPTLALTVARRNPYVDVLNHTQIELLRRLEKEEGRRDELLAILFVTISGIAAGLQTAG